MPYFANRLGRILVFALVIVSFGVGSVAQAAPGASCTNIDGCDSGEACFQNVCRTSCTGNDSVCTGGTTCRLLFSGASARACLPSDNQHTVCNPACATGYDCQFIPSLGETRCIDPDTNAAQPIRDQNSPTQGQPSGGSGDGALINPLGVNSLPELLNAILKGVVQIGSILLVLAIVYVGFLFVFARGDTEQIKNARNALLWTVIGGILLLGAQAISMVIQATVQNL